MRKTKIDIRLKSAKANWWTFLVFTYSLFLVSCNTKPNTTNDLDAQTYAKVDSLMSLMTLEEKVGQMLNLGFAALLEGEFFAGRDTLIFDEEKLNRLLVTYGAGSVQNLSTFPMTPEQWRYNIGFLQEYAKKNTRLKIPLLYGIDAVHGANYTAGSVMTPHQINLAATFEPEFAKIAGELTAYELKASAIPWNYAPVLDVSRHPLWGRIYESFGEDTYLTTEMGKAILDGMQGENPAAYNKVVACPKHFIGYGASYNGKDRSPIMLPERIIRQSLLPPFESAIKMGLLSLMISSGSLNGVPSHVDYNLITKLLKDELGFKGFVLSDWSDVDNLLLIHQVAADEREAVKKSVLAGLDMCMDPYDESFAVHLIELVKDGEVPISRVDDAVRRILYVKFKSGIFEDPMFESRSYDEFASPESDSINHHIACESITLLKNSNDILPLPKESKVLITGVSANSINYLNGAWSRTWSGQDTIFNDLDKLTILQAVQQKIGAENVSYAKGTGYTEEIDIPAAVRKAKQADIIIACVGEKPATEKPSDIDELDLPDVQQQLVKELTATGKPVILVMVQGRPRIIREIEPLSQAIVMAYLPGNEGGRAIADVLFGDHNPSGKLPYTYPRYSGSIWTLDHPISDERDVTFGLDGFKPQYEFGFGLSYTTFEYSEIQLGSDSFPMNESVNISVEVTNTGEIAGKESVLLFVSDEVASISPPVKLLKRFRKINLKPGEKQKVEFTINSDDLKFVDQHNKWIAEPGYFTVRIGDKTDRFYMGGNSK
ncbi:MAG: glycoside hydrolase family 3 C-terminal domain-containing protein [Bacteroidales bacterium]|nr:glycoside hydrolase family 3 C-terminal domain-containing protein [Bacteroidales bacterium]MCF8454353.1 glycoside hydrolase family 3 C-terminal domain-containing protein [Bacteroidales bacterium]